MAPIRKADLLFAQARHDGIVPEHVEGLTASKEAATRASDFVVNTISRPDAPVGDALQDEFSAMVLAAS